MTTANNASSQDIALLSATALARAIRERSVTSRQALEAYLRRIHESGKNINAVVTLDEERARQAADKADAEADEALHTGSPLGPLHGVPMTIKDTWDTEGLRTTAGAPWESKNIPRQDAVVVARLKAAGAIIFGKTNLPLGSYDWQCDNPLFGRTHNPVRHNYVPGGSSGGSAAAVAARHTTFDVGSDVAGSIRFPAHCCGVYGLRPTEGLISAQGHGNLPGVPPSLRSLVSYGPLTRDLDDMMLAFDVLAPEQTSLARLVRAATPKTLSAARIGYSQTLGGVPVSRDTKNVLEDVISRLQSVAASVTEVAPPVDMEEAFENWGMVQGFELRQVYPALLRTWLGSKLMQWLGLPMFFGRGRFARYTGRGFSASPGTYFRALQQRDILIEKADRFFADYDLWITPVASTPSFPYQKQGKPIDIDGVSVAYGDVVGMYCCPTATTAHPVLTIPAGTSADGLPIGLQLHARRCNDMVLLHFAREIVACLEASRM